MKKHIPNIITLLNLFSGCIGIIMVLKYNLVFGAYMIVVAAIFDFFDGMTARLLHVKSEIGKQLDSLADVVSFGVLPGMIMLRLMLESTNLPFAECKINPLPYAGLIIPLFSALRLAKFNIDTRQTNSFLGLPVPANALFMGSLLLIKNSQSENFMSIWISSLIGNYYILLILAIIFSILLITELPLVALKFHSIKFADNKPQYLIIITSIMLLLFFQISAVPLIIIAYILISLLMKPS